MQKIDNSQVMKRKCETCPFHTNERGRYACPDLVSRIMKQVLTDSSQFCHHPRFVEKPETYICRGARDVQLEIFHRLGVIDSPTDEAWEQEGQRRQKAFMKCV